MDSHNWKTPVDSDLGLKLLQDLATDMEKQLDLEQNMG